MRIKKISNLRLIAKIFSSLFALLLISSYAVSPAQAFAGTLQNGDMAYAESAFNTGETCIYLPGFETGYDAWHFILMARGATFQQDLRNPNAAVNLNLNFMRPDGSMFTIRSGAWVQSGKGAYVYTLVSERDRMVQAGSLAIIDGLDSGMRLSHTCPGSGSVNPSTLVSPTPSTSTSPTSTPTSTPTSSSTPTNSSSSSPSPSATPTQSPTSSPSSSPSTSPTVSASPSSSPSTTSTAIPTLAPAPNPTPSAIQLHSTRSPNGRRNPLPTPTPSVQPIGSTPTPTSLPSRGARPTVAPTTITSNSPVSTSSSSPIAKPTNPTKPSPVTTKPKIVSGDVPSIIQTGSDKNVIGISKYVVGLLMISGITILVFKLRKRYKYE